MDIITIYNINSNNHNRKHNNSYNDYDNYNNNHNYNHDHKHNHNVNHKYNHSYKVHHDNTNHGRRKREGLDVEMPEGMVPPCSRSLQTF